MPIHLYAEQLLHIGFLSIQASLSTFSNKETKAIISADSSASGSVLTLTHEGETASIKLPINVSPNKTSSATVTLPAAPTKDVSMRLQLEEKAGVANGLLSRAEQEDGDVVPWTARDLTGETELCCRSCASVLVPRGRVRLWKDLPSEGWAEMMEFWHCHKPNEPEHDHAASNKAYAGGAQLVLEPGVGLVNTMEFLLSPQECTSIKISSLSEDAIEKFLLCNECAATIGHIDNSTQGYRLGKLHLSVSTSPETISKAHDIGKWLACRLLCATESQGVRKFTVSDGNNDAESMKLWVFTPDLMVSSSAAQSGDPRRVAKVLWQESKQPVDNDQLNGQSQLEGELRLEHEEVRLLRSYLSESASLLPESSRRFQEWNVGLLECFSAADVAG